MRNRNAVLSDLQRTIRTLLVCAGDVRDCADSRNYSGAFEALATLDRERTGLEREVLELMRADGLTWQEIGAELGVTRQAAQKRHRLAAA